MNLLNVKKQQIIKNTLWVNFFSKNIPPSAI